MNSIEAISMDMEARVVFGLFFAYAEYDFEFSNVPSDENFAIPNPFKLRLLLYTTASGRICEAP